MCSFYKDNRRQSIFLNKNDLFLCEILCNKQSVPLYTFCQNLNNICYPLNHD